LDAAIPEKGIVLGVPDTAVRLLRRRLKDATVIMLFNESASTVKNQLLVAGAEGEIAERWDPETGSAVALRSSYPIPLEMAPYTTAVFLVRQATSWFNHLDCLRPRGSQCKPKS
jgi:hypothetical protein